MTIVEQHRGVKLELDKSDSLNYVSFLPEEIDYWLNRAIRQFGKTRYSGTNPKNESFEQTQKRIDDLRTLVVETNIVTDSNSSTKPNAYLAELPDDYWFTVGEEVTINFVYTDTPVIVHGSSVLTANTCYVVSGTVWYDSIVYTDGQIFRTNTDNTTFTGTGTVKELYAKRQGVTEITTDRYRNAIDNPFSDHILHYYDARPLRLFYSNYVELISDGNYYISDYHLRYIRKPAEVSNYTKVVESGDITVGNTYKVLGGTIYYLTVTGDLYSQLGAISLLGVTYPGNSYNWKEYWKLYLTGGNYTLELYKDPGKAGGDLVASGYITTAKGTVVLAQENGSGVSGTIDIDYSVNDTGATNTIGRLYLSGTTFVGGVSSSTFDVIAATPVIYGLIDCDLPEHTHDEIIRTAVSMMIENVGDTQRYQTNMVELNKME